ncbi:MAG: phage tail tape measure protein [Culturomica sp.]|jgi:TP901 family phage tail tape measure protein|nr:phage tail tape measure protein [Culturomica sp.]
MILSVVFEYFDKATAPIKKTEATLNGFKKTIDATQTCLWKFNQTAELFEQAGSTIERLAQPGLEFEAAMAELSSITGIAGRELEDLGNVARRTGKASGLGAAGAANAFAILASQIDVSKIGMQGLQELQQKTITLAQASGLGMQEAADAMAGTINQFGLEADAAGRIINVLAAGSKYGAAEIPDLAQSFKVVGAAANAAGLSVEQTAGAIEVLSQNNLKGAEAGTALRNIVLKMQTALGVDFRKTSLEEALTRLKPHLRDATYMSKLFGMENVAAAQFLVANAADIGEMTAAVTDTSVATEQAAVRMDTWGQRIKVNAAYWNDWAIGVQKNFGNLMYGLQVVGQGLSGAMSLAPIYKLVVGTGKGAWSAAMGVVKFGSTLRMLSIAKATRSADVYARAVQRCGRMGRIASGVLSVYNAVLSKAFWITLKNSIATKLSAAALWLKNKALTAGSVIGKAWNAITAQSTWIQMRQTMATKLQTVWTFISSKAMLAAGVATAAWSKATAAAAWVQGGLAKALMVCRTVMTGTLLPALTGVIASTWAWTAALLANPLTWIVGLIGALVWVLVACWNKFAGFRAFLLTIWDAVKGFGEAIYNWLVAPFKEAWEIVAGIGKAIKTLFSGGSWSDAGKELKDGFTASAEAYVDSRNKAAHGFVDTAKGIGGNYKMHLKEERAKQEAKEKTGNVAVPAAPVVNIAAAGPAVPPAEVAVYPEASGMELPGMVLPDVSVSAPALPEGSVSPKAPLTPPPEPVVPVVRLPHPEEAAVYTEAAGTELPEVVMPDINMPGFAPEELAMYPELNQPAPLMPDILGLGDPGNYSVEVARQVGRTNSYPAADTPSSPATAGASDGARVSINFQPVINISAEMTQKAKEDLWQVLKSLGAEIARLVGEEQRKEGRTAYAVS